MVLWTFRSRLITSNYLKIAFCGQAVYFYLYFLEYLLKLFHMNIKKTTALVAHDMMKMDMVEWVRWNKDIISSAL